MRGTLGGCVKGFQIWRYAASGGTGVIAAETNAARSFAAASGEMIGGGRTVATGTLSAIVTGLPAGDLSIFSPTRLFARSGNTKIPTQRTPSSDIWVASNNKQNFYLSRETAVQDAELKIMDYVTSNTSPRTAAYLRVSLSHPGGAGPCEVCTSAWWQMKLKRPFVWVDIFFPNMNQTISKTRATLSGLFGGGINSLSR